MKKESKDRFVSRQIQQATQIDLPGPQVSCLVISSFSAYHPYFEVIDGNKSVNTTRQGPNKRSKSPFVSRSPLSMLTGVGLTKYPATSNNSPQKLVNADSWLATQ